MNHYDICFAKDVSCYGTVLIEAEDDEQAIEIAKAFDFDNVISKPVYGNESCKRIVDIQDESGDIIAEDIPLDDSFLRNGVTERRLCDHADDVLEALAMAESTLRACSTMNDALSESVKPLWVAEQIKALRLKITGEAGE